MHGRMSKSRAMSVWRRPVRLSGSESNRRQSSFAKASEDTPSSNEPRVACHPKLEERRVVPPDGIEPPTFGLQNRCSTS
ncbi:hypothetical protein MESS4_560098 [Mesorhizobium sp. STM 4661]|nr:hypothetical protein MESS4_560098 [Mesorhizobium sp. STM 4661]